MKSACGLPGMQRICIVQKKCRLGWSNDSAGQRILKNGLKRVGKDREQRINFFLLVFFLCV